MLRKSGHRVPATSIAKIRLLATRMRSLFSVLGAPESGKVDIIEVLDIHLPSLMEDFYLEPVPDGSMGDDHARTYPDKAHIQVQESTYQGACKGNGRDVFTLAHELGHLLLHRGVSSYARANSTTKPKAYEDSEWQADVFAAEFLMPFDEVMQCRSAREVEQKFGVSAHAAEVRFNKVHTK